MQTPSLMVLDLMASPSLFRASAAIGVTSESHLRGLSRSGQLFYELPAPLVIEIANRLHRRVITEVFGEDGPHLTARELECLRWVALGKSTGEIAAILKISPHTTREYMKSVHHKLDCVTSAQAVSKAIQMGLLAL